MIDYIEHYALDECKDCTSGKTSPYMPKAYEPRYDEIKLTKENILRFDNTGDYTPQGGCTDGGYLYRALVKEDEENTILQKIDLESGAIVLEVQNYSYGHANDMTYNSKDNSLYIAHSSSTSIVYRVNPDTLEYIDTIDFGPAIWGLAYNRLNDVYALGNVGSAYFSVYNNIRDKPEFMFRVKPQNAFTGTVRQGIACDDNYLYVALDNAYGANIENDKGSRVMIYTWNGMFIKSLFINIKEIEFLAVHGRTMYIGTYEGRNSANKKSGYIYKIDVDLYPEQTVITGRPTDVSGGFNNLQRLPEGTNVRLYNGEAKSAGVVTLDTVNTQLRLTEDTPFRYLIFRFKGANAQTFMWYPVNNGVVCLRETDITAAAQDSTIRNREMRLVFNATAQTFTIDSNFNEDIWYDASEDKIQIIKDTTGERADLIEIEQIWGVV